MAAAAVSLALLAAGLVAGSGLAATAGAVDSVPPHVGNVPWCHIEALPADAPAKTVYCEAPTFTDAATDSPGAPKPGVTPAPTLPATLTSGIHTIVWQNGQTTVHTATNAVLSPETHRVTWAYTDAGGNTAKATQVVIVSDTKPPVFTPEPKSPETVEATAPNTPLTPEGAGFTVSDGVDAQVTLTSSLEKIKINETHDVTWTATDDAGNVSSVQQEITVRDRTPPKVVPKDPPWKILVTTGTEYELTPEIAGVKGVDAGTPNPPVSPSSTELPIGEHTVDWTARDSVGLVSPVVKQHFTVVRHFELESSSIIDRGVNLVFTQNIDPETASGIAAAEMDEYGIINVLPTITINGDTVRLDPKRHPTMPPPVGNQDVVCQHHGIEFRCYNISGQWIITLPGDLSSTHGFYLHDEDQPSFEACKAQVLDATAAVEGCHTPVLRSPPPTLS